METLEGHRTMSVQRMCALIHSMHYRPGWTFKAVDYTKRFEQGCQVTVTFPALNTNQDLAAVGYPVEFELEVNFVIRVCDCATDDDLYFEMWSIIMQIESHEAREFLRVGNDYRAPFHPHRLEGMALFARKLHPGSEDLSILADMNYGR